MSSVVVETHAINLLKGLAEPLRLKIITSLSNGEKCVCDLMEEIGIAQSKISFHLKVLKDTGLITGRQSGRWVYYKLNLNSFKELKAWIEILSKDCQKASTACK